MAAVKPVAAAKPVVTAEPGAAGRPVATAQPVSAARPPGKTDKDNRRHNHNVPQQPQTISNQSGNIPLAMPAGPNVTATVQRTLLKGVFGRTRSRLTGSLLRMPLPETIRTSLFRALLRQWNTDEALLSQPLKEYKSFSDFFSRRYTPEARPVETWDPSSLVSPADGRVVHLERIEDPHSSCLTQLKGACYETSSFLGTTLCGRDAYHSGGLDFLQLRERTAAISYCCECARPICTSAFLSPKRCLSAWKDTPPNEKGGDSSTFEEYVMRQANLKRHAQQPANDSLSTTAESSSSAASLRSKKRTASFASAENNDTTFPCCSCSAGSGHAASPSPYYGRGRSTSSSFASCSTCNGDGLTAPAASAVCPDCEDLAKRKVQWYYCVIYLAPSDYHHFHAPADLQILNRKHFTGEVMPVFKSIASKLNNLFSLNERVVLESRWTGGDLFYAAIAAYNVADIKLVMEPSLETNRSGCTHQKRGHCDIMYYGTATQNNAYRCPDCCSCSESAQVKQHNSTSNKSNHVITSSETTRRPQEDRRAPKDRRARKDRRTQKDRRSRKDRRSLKDLRSRPISPASTGVFVQRGGEIGEFKLGSTVVLLFQAPSSFQWAVGPNDRVVVGQLLGGTNLSVGSSCRRSTTEEKYFDVRGD